MAAWIPGHSEQESLTKRYIPASVPSPVMGPQPPGRLPSLDGPFLFSFVVLEMRAALSTGANVEVACNGSMSQSLDIKATMIGGPEIQGVSEATLVMSGDGMEG